MKKILKTITLALLIAFAPMSLDAKMYDNIYEAQKQALREAKLMVFFVVADTCQYCHKLLNDVLNNKGLMKYLNEKFVVAIADLNHGGVLPADLIFKGVTPTTYILTPTGNVIGMPIEGAVESDMLFGLLRGLEEHKKSQLGF